MVKLTEEQIRQKWRYKTHQMEAQKEREAQRRIEERRVKLHERTVLEQERITEKINRKTRQYINKKRLEYDRKCKNEIRKMQGKEEKKYKQPTLSRNKKLQFAMAIAQENTRLRDTDKNGHGECISCERQCDYEQLAGGHGASRTIQGVCLRESNINAQCHTCNYAMGPQGDPTLKMKTEMQYRTNARAKRGDAEIDMLRDMAHKSIKNPSKYSPSEEYICDIIPELIRKNEELWKTKSPEFRETHKPAKNRRKFREKNFTPKERGIVGD